MVNAMNYLGAVVPVVTPCARSGRLDEEGLRAVCDDMVAAGASGIFVMGSTGRGPWFSPQDRARAVRIARDHLPAHIPVFAGCMANGPADILEHLTRADAEGAAFGVVTAPGYFSYLDSEIELILLDLADRSPLPLLLYDVPVYTGTKLAVESIVRLLSHENIVGMKDSTADGERLHELLDAIRDIRGVWFLQGKEHLLAETMLAGGSGVITTFSHFGPRPYVALCEAGRAGDRARATGIQHHVTALYHLVTECLARRPGISTLFHMVNLAMIRRGVCANILLEHEGPCPDWLETRATEALALARAALEAG